MKYKKNADEQSKTKFIYWSAVGIVIESKWRLYWDRIHRFLLKSNVHQEEEMKERAINAFYSHCPLSCVVFRVSYSALKIPVVALVQNKTKMNLFLLDLDVAIFKKLFHSH